MKKPILKLNIKNLNNRIYTEESVKNIFSNNSIFIYKSFISHFSSPVSRDVTKAIGVVESFEREDDLIIANIDIFDQHKDIWNNLSEFMPLRSAGTGEIDENGVVKDYNICYLSFVSPKDDAFSGIIE